MSSRFEPSGKVDLSNVFLESRTAATTRGEETGEETRRPHLLTVAISRSVSAGPQVIIENQAGGLEAARVQRLQRPHLRRP